MRSALKFNLIKFKLLFLWFLFLSQSGNGQDKVSCTIIYRDSVTQIQPYQVVFDTVKMFYSDNFQRVDYIINQPDTSYFYPNTIIKNDSIRYFSYQNISNQFYYEKLDNSFPYGKDVISLKVISTDEERDILGYNCKKYILHSNLTNGFTTTKFYWITDGFSLGERDPLHLEGIVGYPLQIETVYETKDGIYKYTDVLYAVSVGFDSIDSKYFKIPSESILIPYTTEQFRNEFKTK